MWAGVLATGVVMSGVSLLTLDLYLPGGLIEGSESLTLARTAAFTVLASALLQVAVVHLGFLNLAFFGTMPLAPAQWAVCVGMASVACCGPVNCASWATVPWPGGSAFDEAVI